MTTSERSRIERYDPASIEPRWQARWAELELYEADLEDTSRPKFYMLTMYDYPSGDLHIGHWYTKTPTDALARFRRMHGYNVFFPVGFDAFGLPAEGAAIRNAIHPAIWTMQNIEKMRRQLRSMGAMFQWSAEIITASPEYYRWNQWIFLKLLEAGLAYRAMAPVDWCPNDGTLAREQVVGPERRCWRCGELVEKRDLEQWFLRITKYADELLDFTGLIWPEPIKAQQTNWIGRSEGGEIVFETAPSGHHAGGAELRVFTTRPDTLFGATFMVLAPEHPLVAALTAPDRKAEVEAYIAQAANRTEIDRLSTDREKTGVALGADAINPVNGERIPIFVADYVLGGFGTGAIMAVPAHDERDYAFAVKYGLPIRRVVAAPGDEDSSLDGAYVSHAVNERLVNSGPHTGLPADEGGKAILGELEARGKGRA
ncbi:MAG: class I tRNA ligase family protein, partial [Chloroflexota bacterium]|nr:class I tRNA ligase family protein [Chloroflexota bacterium]